ncbi:MULTISPECIES: hypothetical protein [unclassified Streptomyces]|uniref:hypothetical protein n=1 Tax=unclassified Streptomyces TaxID=2593676 RepID=UPI000B8243AE|nr:MULTISPECIES: hypothetical protein [unclassified Streptomyces]MYR28045.1 hypothetical protein [Streptomyces sp. SID4945]
MTLTDLRDGFRDAEQRQCVQAIIASRLADDREPQECRYLMRFWWQLSMPYREVSVAELRLNVGQQKLNVVMELVSAIRSSHEEIDAWLSGAVQTFPVLQDHGFSATLDSRD